MSAILAGLSAACGVAAFVTAVAAVVLACDDDVVGTSRPVKWLLLAATPILVGLSVVFGVAA